MIYKPKEIIEIHPSHKDLFEGDTGVFSNISYFEQS